MSGRRQAQDKVSDDSSPNADIEADLIPMFTDRMGVILCPEVTRITHFICPQNVM